MKFTSGHVDRKKSFLSCFVILKSVFYAHTMPWYISPGEIPSEANPVMFCRNNGFSKDVNQVLTEPTDGFGINIPYSHKVFYITWAHFWISGLVIQYFQLLACFQFVFMGRIYFIFILVFIRTDQPTSFSICWNADCALHW